MKIAFADLHRALQFAEDWYWDDIEKVLAFYPASDFPGGLREFGEIRLRPDAFDSQILFLHGTLCDQLETFGVDSDVVRHIRRNSQTASTYWGPEIVISDIDLTDVPEDVDL